jgi:hypothetical protein
VDFLFNWLGLFLQAAFSLNRMTDRNSAQVGGTCGQEGFLKCFLWAKCSAQRRENSDPQRLRKGWLIFTKIFR